MQLLHHLSLQFVLELSPSILHKIPWRPEPFQKPAEEHSIWDIHSQALIMFLSFCLNKLVDLWMALPNCTNFLMGRIYYSWLPQRWGWFFFIAKFVKVFLFCRKVRTCIWRKWEYGWQKGAFEWISMRIPIFHLHAHDYKGNSFPSCRFHSFRKRERNQQKGLPHSSPSLLIFSSSKIIIKELRQSNHLNFISKNTFPLTFVSFSKYIGTSILPVIVISL